MGTIVGQRLHVLEVAARTGSAISTHLLAYRISSDEAALSVLLNVNSIKDLSTIYVEAHPSVSVEGRGPVLIPYNGASVTRGNYDRNTKRTQRRRHADHH